MSSLREKQHLEDRDTPYWWWLFLALLLHALFFADVKRSPLEVENATLQVSSGDSAGEMELVQAPEPILPIPLESPSPAPDSAVPKPVEPVTTQSDDFAIPKPVSTPTPVPSATPPSPTSSSNSQVASSHSARVPHPSSSNTSSKQQHVSPPGGRIGSAGHGKASYLYNPEPPYPEEARDALVQGTVELMVSVNETGKVTAVHLLKSSGDPSLDQSALQTVKTEWRFHPATVGGIAIASQILVPIHFKLRE